MSHKLKLINAFFKSSQSIEEKNNSIDFIQKLLSSGFQVQNFLFISSS